MSDKILLAGATSAIAQELAKLLAAEGHELFLVARDERRLRIVADDLRARGAARIECETADLDEVERHPEIVDRAAAVLDGLDTVIVAHGVLGSQERCDADYAEAERILRTNLLGVVSLLTCVARRFEAQGFGRIVAISSVAGDRGRQSNFVYGTSKGALSLYLQGLRNRLFRRGVHVLTVKPGFVDTPMTAGIPKSPLFSRPAAIAQGIRRAMARNKDVVYLPGYWRWIMLVIRLIPEPMFKRLKL